MIKNILCSVANVGQKKNHTMKLVFLFLILYNFSFGQLRENIYLIKNHWHTGFVFINKDEPEKLIPHIKLFGDYQFVDIGWGDEKFYQHPGFNLFLAFRALFIPTSSVVRIQAYSNSIEKYLQISDAALKISITSAQYEKILNYINQSFELRDKEAIITSENKNWRIKFLKSNLKYHLFFTCNTWIAYALKEGGVEIAPAGIITVQQLFNNLGKLKNVTRIK